jgi:two-component system sensor histidine kinase/response regulator
VIQAYEGPNTSVDLKELLARVEYDRELLDDVFQIFRDEFPKLNLLLKDAAARGDLKQVQTSAHTLKGMLASLSFRSASASAMRIERMAKQSDLTGLLTEMRRLESGAAFAQASLERFCAPAV